MVKVKGIDFSRGAYQVEVLDQNQSFWSFLQFDDEENLSDAFCSCEEEELCDHLSTSLLKIYNNQNEPLHVRFYASLWNAICLIFFEEGNRLSYSITPKTARAKKRLRLITENRPLETPETSLKFSNLSPEEIAHWKEGRPNQDLRYELSFWSDLAKWMMFEEESKEPYTLTFEEKNDLPLTLAIEWPDLKAVFHYGVHELIQIIPTLATLNSPLKVHKEKEELIVDMTYNVEFQQIEVKRRPPKKSFSEKGIKVGPWFYVKGEGFYPEVCPDLLNKEVVTKEEIPILLKDYGDVVEKFLPLYKNPQPLRYHLFFDEMWNLHINSFLFKEGDLQKGGFFKTSAYIEEKGFFSLANPLFDQPQLVIPEKDVPHFIHKHRNWILGIEGFSIHLSSYETTLTYEVTKKGVLRFLSPEETIRIHDFGDLIYLQGQGFFSKRGFQSLSLMAGLEIGPFEVGPFIKLKRDELMSIPGFFSDLQPLAKRGIKVWLEGHEIHIHPDVELIDELKGSFFLFFDGFVYVEGKGFSEIPPEMFLKERYTQEVILSEKEQVLFFKDEFPKLKKVITELDPRLQEAHRFDLSLTFLEKNPQGGLRGNFYYETELGTVFASEIYEATLAKKRFFFSSAGKIDLLDENLSWISKIKKTDQHQSTLSTVDFLRLDQSQNIHTKDDASKKILHELRYFEVEEKPNLKGLNSQLRLYQQTGLFWLWFLYKNDLSGLLCDDMGLGKTHQAMALIAAALNDHGGRFLIVSPTSVIYHWQEKLAQFLPKVKVNFFHGMKRSLKHLPREGIILTSYGILRLERERLEKMNFEIAIFDEMQVAKNPSSLLHDALLKIRSKMVIGLSGTPIENNLRELKALFDIALPGYLPPESQFRDQYILPIEKEGSSEKKEALSKIIKPFILRRKKRDVLQELPEKSEDKTYAELSEDQEKLYLATLEKNRPKVVSQLEKGEIPYVHIFSILSTLKQVCDHPALVLKEPQNYKNYQSGKWDLFVELLEEALEGEQKVVVFSQYLQMLDIMQNFLQEKGISYAQIRGDTRNRREEMRRFQEDPNCQVFIGTLQAAGLGIDLTAANIVILYDRWWNAARENQAIDRVHRIGQKWGVQVYKLITKGTIEEKIDALITRKGLLLEEIITADDETQIKKFTREEILDLLTFNPQK